MSLYYGHRVARIAHFRKNNQLHASVSASTQKAPTLSRIAFGSADEQPIPTGAQDFDFTARWQRQDAVRSIRSCKTRLDVLARYYGQGASIAPAFECIHSVDRHGADQQAKY